MAEHSLYQWTMQKLVNPKTSTPLSLTTTCKKDPNEKMWACAWYGKDEMRMVQVPKPCLTDPGDIVVKVTATTVCGSDLHMYKAQVPGMRVMENGDIMGHEFMGIVESVGAEVNTLAPGDRVVVAFDIACGQCNYCQEKSFSMCDTTNPSGQMEKLFGHRCAGIFGYSQLTGGFDGGQAEYVRVPFADVNALKLPRNLPDEKLLFLSDIACTSYHGVELGNVKQGDRVVIWGAGPVGLLTVQWCKVRGAAQVVIIDNEDYRLAKARELGAETLDFSKANVIDSLQNMVPAGQDVSIDCAGYRFPTSKTHKAEFMLGMETDALDIIEEMVKTTRKCGHIVLIGDYFGYGNHFPIGALMEKSITMNGGQAFVQKYWKDVLGHIERGEFDPTVVHTHTMSLEETPQVYKMFDKHEDHMIKAVIRTPAGVEMSDRMARGEFE